MKTLLIVLSLLLPFLTAPESVAAQNGSVEIAPEKVVFTRPQPQADYKKTFVVNRPTVKAKTAALSKKIEAAISYETMREFDLKNEMGEYQWLEEASFTVDYNKNNVLSVTLLLEGSAAYPSSASKLVNVDTTTGTRILPQTVFVNHAGLAAKCRQMQQAEIEKARADYKKDPENADFDADEYFKRAKFTAVELNAFTINDKGVTFFYNYEFAHVVQALQPEGAYFFAWRELKPFVKKGGLFWQFVK